MPEKSRTEYSARNTTVAIIGRLTAIFLGFITRVVFTHTLSEDYVGVNGLFTDIINVLSLSELGIGTAITYALYKPISEGNIEKQKSLMLLYRHFYRIVAGVVLICGLLVIPFMDILIKDTPNIEHLTPIYIMYLSNSVLSYMLIYKKTLVDAHQLSYIGVLYQTVFLIIQDALQIGILFITHNYYLFLLCLILCTLGSNICISKKADSLYPYLRDKNIEKLSKEECKGIFANIRAMMMHKVGNVAVNNTDNLLLSALVGTLSVGRYSNYYLIIGSVRQILQQMFQGITASVGNLGVEEEKGRIRKIFEASFFLGQWVYGLAAICIYQCIDAFVGFSFGTQYIFDKNITLILCINFYLTGMRQPTLVFRDSMGLFKYDRYKSLAEAAINIAVSLVLGKIYGTAGIFIGTMISTVTTSLWVEPYMLYKHKLETSFLKYFIRYFLYALITGLLWWGENILCVQIQGNVIVTCFMRFFVCFALTNAAYLMIYHRTEEFKLLWNKGMGIVRSRFSKNRKGNSSVSIKNNSEFFLPDEEKLLELLDASLNGRKIKKAEISDGVLDLAEKHGALPLLFPVVESNERVRGSAYACTLSNYRLLFLSKYLINLLTSNDIEVVLLKGAGTASYYPVPEYRKSGDVDLLLLNSDRLKDCKRVLGNAGFSLQEDQLALHHLSFESKDKIEIEVHTMLAEPFDNGMINRYLEDALAECKTEIEVRDIMGIKLPVLKDGFHAYELLLHMLQHFLRSGFGIKLLCDWTVLWNHGINNTESLKYERLVKESGLCGVSDAITRSCIKYLGLKKEFAPKLFSPEYEEHDLEFIFMKEILEAEEFGKSGKDRMVGLRSNSASSFMIEFHHQMHLNFPRCGKCFLLWPILWIVTLFRFLYNNRTIRKTSAGKILKKAGKRGKIIEYLQLWEKIRK